MFLKRRKILNEFDDTFKKLLDVVPQNLTREKTRAYLKKFAVQEMPKHEGVEADLFTRPKSVPTNVLYVSYGTKNRAAASTINIGYPPYVWKKISQAHRKLMSKKLDSILDEKFAKATGADNIVYWQKGFTVVIKKMKEMQKGKFKGVIFIELESFDTRVFPFEVILKELKSKN